MLRFLSTFQTLSSHLVRARMFFVALCCVLLFSGIAHASLIPSLVGGPVDIGGGRFQYNYKITLSADERLDVTQTNGVTCPGPSNSNVQCSPAGTFVTIYDVPGFQNAGYTPDATTPVGGFFNTSVNSLGPTPNSINGAAFDSASLLNVTWTYTGSNVAGPTTFTGFYIVTSYSGINPVGNFTMQATNNTFQSDGTTPTSTNGTSDQLIGSVPIPIGPSAATATVSGKITTPLGRGVRDIRVTITDTSSGEIKIALTGQFGYYNFPDMQVGKTYIITATGKHYTFMQSTQLKLVLNDTPDVDFMALAEGK